MRETDIASGRTRRKCHIQPMVDCHSYTPHEAKLVDQGLNRGRGGGDPDPEGGAAGEATHWTAPAMARASGLSVSSVQRIWRVHGLRPHQTQSFKL